MDGKSTKEQRGIKSVRSSIDIGKEKGSSKSIPTSQSLPSSSSTLTSPPSHKRAQSGSSKPLRLDEDSQALKLEHVKELKASANTFVKSLLRKKMTPDQQRQNIITYIHDIEIAIDNHPLWKETDLFDIASLKEEIKAEIFNKIYSTLFDNPEDKAEDEAMAMRIDKLSWIQPKHIDISQQFSDYELWETAGAELKNINNFVTPKEKLVAVLNCCKILIFLLQQHGSVASADDFLPQLIYTTLRTNPPRIQSNIKFISTFVDPDQTNGEAYCYFTHLVSAVSFISIIDEKCLNISHEDYNKYMGIEDGSSVNKAPLEKQTTSRKALKILGVDPSAKKVMNKLGVDERTLKKEMAIFQQAVTSSEGFSGSQDSVGNLNALLEAHKRTIKDASSEVVKSGMEKLEIRFPFLRYTIGQIRVDQLSDLLYSYKQLCMHVLMQEYARDEKIQIDFQRPLRVKVREQGDKNFKLIHIEQLSISALQEAIKKRLEKSNEIAEIKLIPDVLIEQDDDVLQLDDMSSLEVNFCK